MTAPRLPGETVKNGENGEHGARAEGGRARAAPPLEVVVFGGFFLELVFGHVPRWPGPGEEIFTDEFALSCGGAITVADAAARGGARTGIAARFGPDLGSRVVQHHAASVGVDLSPSVWGPEPAAGITVVANFAAERSFLSHVPERGHRAAEIARWTEVLRRERPAWCCLHAGAGVAPFLREARRLGVAILLDASFEATDAQPAAVLECARLADVFVPNEAELQRLTGGLPTAESAALAARWCPQVVVKLGPAGALLLEGGTVEEIAEGLEDVVVRDRTGAGDAFAGAMLATLVRGGTLRQAVVAGNSAGSQAVARPGGVGEVHLGGLDTTTIEERRPGRGAAQQERTGS
jgi:sugar/nucleoside kinase (ribokinase family)